MNSRPKVILSIVAFLSVSLCCEFGQAVIFGKDDRHQVSEMPADIQAIARSVAVKVPAGMVPDTGGVYDGVTLSHNYCAANHFSSEIVLPARACTAFLVKPDVVVTAAHCIKAEEDICGPDGNFRYLFDYRTNVGGGGYLQIKPEQLYKCKAILGRRLDGFGAVDYAIIQLDRPVTDRVPLKLDLSGTAAPGDRVFSIGYPTGLPEKVTDNGTIIEVKGGQEIGTDLDLFAGNSGSPIFNLSTKAVIAVNSHGEGDWVREGSCKMAKQCELATCIHSFASLASNMKDEPGIR